MTISTQRFYHKPVDAIQVTDENILQVAVWCHGEAFQSLEHFPKKYIQLTVNHPTGRRGAKAFAGDWIVTVKGQFKVYNNRAFTETFNLAPSHEAVLELVKTAMGKQDVATYLGESSTGVEGVADETTRKILDLF